MGFRPLNGVLFYLQPQSPYVIDLIIRFRPLNGVLFYLPTLDRFAIIDFDYEFSSPQRGSFLSTLPLAAP